MAVVGEAVVDLRVETGRLGSDIQKGINGALKDAEASVNQFGKTADTRFGQATKNVQAFTSRAAIPAALALGSIVGATIKFAGAAEEAEVANRRLAQVLSSMGYSEATARVSAYADQLERQVAVDGEVIKATQAKLATFENLTRTANETGGAFDRATVAALDLAAAGFGSAETNAIQLGKALQDPIKGITALARSGVTFTAQEKEKIKTLVESNRILEAQDLVLKAIEKQVGGTAAATATDSARMQIAFENMQEAIGAALLPVLRQLTSILQAVGDWIQNNTGLFLAATGVLAGVSLAVLAVNAAFKAYQAVALVVKGVNALLDTSFKTLHISMGLVAVALTAAIGIYAAVTNNKKDYTGVTNQLTAALDLEGEAQTNALAQLIETNGAFRKLVETANKFGVSTKELTKGINGTNKEYEQMAKRLYDAEMANGAMSWSTWEVIQTLQQMRDEVLRQREAFALASNEGNVFERVLNKIRGAITGPAQNLRTLVANNLDWYNSTRVSSGGTNKMAESLDKLRDSLRNVRSAASDSLKKAMEDFRQFSASVSSAIQSGLSFATAFSDKDTDTFLGSLEKQAARIKDFGVLLNRLIAKGASEAVLQQVIGAGVEAGSAIAEELLATTGGVETANRLAQEVQSIAQSVGQNAAGTFRQAGVDTATALVNGIESVLSKYQIRLRSKGLTDAQLKRLKRNFQTEVAFEFIAAGAEVPQLANGALVSSPQLAMIGERGPEAVIPISRPQRALELLETSGLAALVRSSGGGAAVSIGSATFVQPVDVDMLAQKILVAERSRAWSS